MFRQFPGTSRLAWVTLLLLLAGCSQAPQLPGFDTAAWRADTRACTGTGARARLAPIIEAHRQQLYGLRNGVVNDLLGRPDEEELLEQTQRVFYYYVASGPQCAAGHPRSNARRLRISFGALGTATEVLFTTAPPIDRR